MDHLIISTLQVVQRIAIAEHRTGTHCGIYVYMGGVQHIEFYNKIVQTAVGGEIGMSVQSGMGIRLAEGVETVAVADDAVDGIGKGVFHKQVHHHIAVATCNCLMTEHEIFGYGMIYTLIAKHFACADCIVTLCAESVVDV